MATKVSEFECKTLHSKTKTLVVEANFSAAANDDQTPSIQVFDSKFSRFTVSIIDTEAETKTVSANIKVTKEADPFIRMAEAGIERVIFQMYSSREEKPEEDAAGGTTPAYTHILFSDPFQGKTVATVLTDGDVEENKKALGKIYKELLSTKDQYPENLPEMAAIMDGSNLLKEGKLVAAGVQDQKDNPAYSQKIFALKMTAAEALSEAGGEEKLRKLYADLDRNKNKYKNNVIQMQAISEGLSLLQAGALEKTSKKSAYTLYKCGPKGNTYRKEEDGLTHCTELTLSMYPGDNSPFVLCIENFNAPVKEDESGRQTPLKSQAKDIVKHDFRINLYDMISLVEEMKRQMSAFFSNNYGTAYRKASDEMLRHRQEWKEAAE